MVNSQFSVSVHILTLLASASDSWLTSSYMASSVNTNPALIRKLLSKLVKAGFVETRQGIEGGARLKVPAKEILLSRVFDAVIEGGIYSLHSDCNPLCPVGSRIEKTLRGTFSTWESSLKENMGAMSVADVFKDLSR